MFYRNNILYLFLVLTTMVVTHNYCAQPRGIKIDKGLPVDSGNIQQQIDLESVREKPVEIFRRKVVAFEALIQDQQLRNNIKVRMLDKTHFNALDDILENLKDLVNSSIEEKSLGKNNDNMVLWALADIEGLSQAVIKELKEAYGMLSVYNQKTTSIKTRISNLFKEKGTERSTTSSAEKEKIRKMVPEFISNLEKLQKRCNKEVNTLEEKMQKNPQVKQNLLLMQMFIQTTLIILIEKCINDLY